MKLLSLALLLAGFSICTLSAVPDSPAEVDRKTDKCHRAGGKMKEGRCMKKGDELQALRIKK